jgi:hypothetical protein
MAHVRWLLTATMQGDCSTSRIVDGDPGPGEVARSMVDAYAAIPGFPMEVVEDAPPQPAPLLKRKRGRPRKSP